MQAENAKFLCKGVLLVGNHWTQRDKNRVLFASQGHFFILWSWIIYKPAISLPLSFEDIHLYLLSLGQGFNQWCHACNKLKIPGVNVILSLHSTYPIIFSSSQDGGFEQTFSCHQNFKYHFYFKMLVFKRQAQNG